ncbi:MAG: hypothetical protein KDA47_13700, partial [Planctomycetales bacterium]|nr:hypothetical protein [Planctomycetales bacterium]
MRRSTALAVALAVACSTATVRGQVGGQGTLPSPYERGANSPAPAAPPPVTTAMPGGAAAPNASGSSSASAFAAQLPRTTTRYTAFEMGFSVEQMESPAVEVQLFISKDQGAKWDLYSRQAPSAGRFLFRATGDGEYWFASRTVDQRGRSFPDGPLRPEQAVIIDTTQPRLEFQATPGPAGEVLAEWRVFDPTLDPRSLRIEYQSAAGQPWQPVNIESPTEPGERHNLTGRTSWWPPESESPVNVRAEVRDQAGNATVVVRQVAIPKVAARGAAPNEAGPAPPVDRNAWQPPPSAGATTWPANNAIAATGGSANAAQVANQPSPPNSGSPQSQFTGANQPQRIPAQPASQERTTAQSIPGLPAQQPMPDHVRPGVADQATPANQSQPAVEEMVVLPSGVQPQMTNLRRFNLDYDVDSVGPEGVADVQLWVTRNGGQKWDYWGVDKDRTSPLNVEVDRDGIYGFSIVVIGNNGLASRQPQPGDLADLWVGVDSTAPTTRLTSANYGQGNEVGQLIIRWQADDPRLTERPVTLSFSDQANGPWTTIAASLPNNGQYNWPADPRLPEQIYLKIEVRDEAGNIGVDQLTEPIDVQGLTPKGRIRGFRPATTNNDATRGA